MDVQIRELSPHTQLLVIPTTKFKTITVTLQFTQRLDHQRAAARAVLRKLLTSATQRYPSLRSFANARNDLYGLSVQADSLRRGEGLETTFTFTTINGDYVDDSHLFPRVIEFIKEVFDAPLLEDGKFPVSYFEERKKAHLSSYQSALDDKSTYATIQLYDLVDAKDPVSVTTLGNEQTIPAVTLAEVMQEYHDLIGSPKVIAVVGDVDEQHMIQWFSNWLPVTASSIPQAIAKVQPRSLVQRIDEKPFQQSVLTSLYTVQAPFDTADEKAAILMNAMFGGTALSKLFKVVREEHNYCYSIYTRFAASYSLIELSAEIAPENYQHSMILIAEQLDALVKGDFTDDDLVMTRNLLINSIRRGYDSPQGMISFFSTQLVRQHQLTPERFEQEIMRVSRQDIQRLAATVQLHTHYFLKAHEGGEHEND